MHTFTEPIEHPRLSNFSLKPKLQYCFALTFVTLTMLLLMKKRFLETQAEILQEETALVFEALTHLHCSVVRFCTIYFFV